VAITTEEIADMLRPNWRGPGTNAVSKTRALIEQVLNTVDNPAASWSRLRTRNLARKAPETKNMASLPYAQVPGLMIELRRSQHPAARLLQFLILTGVRLDEAREAQWSEIKGDLWTIAAGRMKKRIEHVGPLSPQALAVLGERGEGPVFGIGATAVWECLKSFNRVDKHGDQITTHGFRSSMATWAEENRWAPNVIEAALAHRKGDKTKAAYQRSPLLEERRKLADAWADFATG
jgi:integrase